MTSWYQRSGWEVFYTSSSPDELLISLLLAVNRLSSVYHCRADTRCESTWWQSSSINWTTVRLHKHTHTSPCQQRCFTLIQTTGAGFRPLSPRKGSALGCGWWFLTVPAFTSPLQSHYVRNMFPAEPSVKPTKCLLFKQFICFMSSETPKS